MAKQINIFVDNRIGRMLKIAEVMYNANINIRALAIQDRGDFGLVKLVVNKPEQAILALRESAFASAVKDVLAVIMEDKPGGLYQLLKNFPEEGVNILDAYGFAAETSQGAVFFIEVKDPVSTRNFLQEKGYKVLTDQELYEL